MANIGAYSRHKFLGEVTSPLYTANGDGAVANVYSPDEQRAKILANLAFDAVPSGVAITTSATTALAGHYPDGALSGTIILACTAFAMGTITDNAATAFGNSLISFPTGTHVEGIGIYGNVNVTDPGASDRTTAIELGLGTTQGTGANATLGAQAAGAESILGGTATSAFTANVATINAPDSATPTAKTTIANGVTLRTTTPGLVVFLNGAGAGQDITGNVDVTFTGKVALRYYKLA